MTIPSILQALNSHANLQDYQVEEILLYVKKNHRAYVNVAKAMLAKYASSTASQRVNLVSAIKKYFPPS